MRDGTNTAYLFRQLLSRELAARYKSTILGSGWIVMQPLLMLCVYTVVFNYIFQVRWAGVESTTGFAIMLFAGLIVFNFFAEVLTASPTLVLGQPNLVKKVVFPVEMLAVVRVSAAFITALIGVLILFVAHLLFVGLPTAWFAAVFLPLVVMFPMLLGIAWLLSAFGVYLRDISQFTGITASVMLFVSPIFFPATAMPDSFSLILKINPLVTPMQELRAVALSGVAPDLVALSYYFCVSCVFARMALACFRRLSTGFADVL
ncbi:ABC transporter permease [Luteimonas aestuarii]|uniref:Transport permease protein n=1 Tax=Luteimonas aestuarii TaxID=453837 RepID=A0A4R5TTL2_9GAMM|nr:ABC transporter permease [Luteimonas aestuarii]TDK24281.1 ABC transporter permease [Luteimonas aestuarii]